MSLKLEMPQVMRCIGFSKNRYRSSPAHTKQLGPCHDPGTLDAWILVYNVIRQIMSYSIVQTNSSPGFVNLSPEVPFSGDPFFCAMTHINSTSKSGSSSDLPSPACNTSTCNMSNPTSASNSRFLSTPQLLHNISWPRNSPWSSSLSIVARLKTKTPPGFNQSWILVSIALSFDCRRYVNIGNLG